MTPLPRRPGLMRLAILLSIALLAPSAPAQPSDSVDAATERVWPALVRIHVVNAYYREGYARKTEGSGSGFIISPDGLVVTNHHVAGNAVRLVCTLPSREEIEAELIGTDAMSDIAVLRLRGEPSRRYPYVGWGASSALKVGEPVLAMGSPLSLSQSVTRGIVSNTAMTMPRWAGEMILDGEDVGSIVRWIFHDAEIHPGNSGGPLVNLSGEVVGVNEISYGLGGAIPSDLAREIVAELIEQGDISRGYVGLLLQPLFKHANLKSGVFINDVVPRSPAQAAGIEPGDVLLSLRPEGGSWQNLTARFAEDLPPINRTLAALPIGRPVELRLQRGDDNLTLTLAPERRQTVERDQKEFKPWGITGRNLSMWTAIDLKRSSSDGLLVTSVRSGGPAGQAKPPIEPGDVIVALDGHTLRSMDGFTSLTEHLLPTEDGVTTPVVVAYERRGQRLLTVVDIGLEESQDPGREVRKAWIPVASQVITRELARGLDLPEGTTGVRVTQLYADSDSSASMGLRVGDLIVAFDGERIPATEPHDHEVFPTMVRQYRIGTEVALDVIRAGDPIQLSGALPARPPESREMRRYIDHEFDFTVRETAYLDRIENQWEDEPEGLMILSVVDGGWASLAGLRTNDLILAIDDTEVRTVEQIELRLDTIKQGRPDAVIFKVKRGVYTRFIEVEPSWED